MQATLTLIGMHNYLYDPDNNPYGLFKPLSVPNNTIDKDTLIANILLHGQEFEMLYPDPDLMYTLIDLWSKKWADTITRWWTAFHQTYSPIDNYNRHEDYTDTKGGSNSGSVSNSGSGSGSSSDSNEHTVSAFDATTYSPRDKDTGSGTTSSQFSNSGTNSNEYSESLEHHGHLYGNIGVTTTQAMITEEFNLYLTNLYDEIANLFLREFVIPVN